MVLMGHLNHGLNQWFKPFGLNQPTLIAHPLKIELKHNRYNIFFAALTHSGI